MKPIHTLVLLSPLVLPACLETEEEIEVRTDGSLAVTLRAEGNLWDLAAGHPLPLGGPWEPRDEATRAWVREVGPATGGEARARLEQGAWAAYKDPENDKVALSVAATFDDAAELPGFFAPAGAPYRSALLERSTSLAVEGKGGRTVYRFERTFGARPFWPQLEGDDWLPEDVREKLDAKERLSREQVAGVHALLIAHLTNPETMQVVSSPLTAIYTEGEASLSTAGYERTLAALHRAAREIVSLERIQALFDAVYVVAHDEDAKMPDEVDLEELLRDAARETIEASLTAEGLAPEVRNAVRERLEWNFSSYDQAEDLSDESFVLKVTMPGDVVGGNYLALDGRTASWTFDGGDLYSRELRLEVVSVVE
jgi:hypothetical protein